MIYDRRAERSRAATDVEPSAGSRNLQPGEKERGNLTAPAPDVLLVRAAARPRIGYNSVAHDSAQRPPAKYHVTYVTTTQVMYDAATSPNNPAISLQPAGPRVLNAYQGMTIGQASNRK